MEEWKEYKIGDICDFQNGYAFKSSDFADKGENRVVKIKELKDGLVKFFNDSSYVTCDDKDIIDKFAINYLDVLFALTGDPVNKPNPLSWVGRVSLYKYEETSLMNQRVCKTLPSEKIDNLFLYYYFRQPDVFYQLASKATGSASQANISTRTIADVSICLPPLQVQKNIVSILKTLDDKIEVNRRIKDNLELQAQALFKSWFVDFEPFRNDEFVESELGMIPKGWIVYEFNNILSPISEKVGNRSVTEYSVGNDGIKSRNEIYHKNICSNPEKNRIIKKGNLVFGMGSDRVTWGVMKDEIGATSPAYPVYQITKEIDSIYFEFFFRIFYSRSKDLIRPSVRQGQTIDKGALMHKKIYVPTKNSWDDFNVIYKTITNKIQSIEMESRRLTTLRDTLLPKLMSGELSVNDIKE